MKMYQLFKMAIRSIIGNKVRSILTMLGIIIGIASVIILVAMGQGTTKAVQDSITSMGTNLITVSIMGNRSATVTTKELEQLKTKPGIKDISPTLSESVTIKGNDQSTTTTAQAVEPNFTTIRNMTVASGRFINDTDLENRYTSVVVGTDVATSLFNTTDVVGQTLNVNGVDFTIVGVLNSMGTTSSGSSDNTILLPLTTAQRLLKTTQVRTFYVQASSSSSVDSAMSYLQIFLEKKFNLIGSTTTNTNKYFRVMNETSLLQTATSTQQSMTNMLSGIAAISLLVGGIGIMNIMLVSVMERTREIGIRKALGAKRRAILLQFLIEAVFVSGLGGILGILIGVLGSLALQTYANMAMSLSTNIALAAFAFSVTVGIVFGLYPASKASKLNPIDALSYE